jgi:hypothetical protein
MKAWVVALFAAVVSQGSVVVKGQDGVAERVTLSFSDPARAGTLVVQMLSGSLTINASDRQDVAVEARSDGRRQNAAGAPDAPAGLRRLVQPAGFVVEESDNVIRISSGFGRDPVDFIVQVPLRTNLKLRVINGGPLTVDGVDGDIEADNINGSITLTNVAGSVVAHSTNGEVKASLTRVADGKAMAFTTVNGNVDVTLPASAGGNLSLRSMHGEVYTDFDLQLTPPSASPVVRDGRPGGRYRIEIDRAIYGTLNGGGPDFELRTLNGNVYVRRRQ